MKDFIERDLEEVRADLMRIKEFFQEQSFHNFAMQKTLIEYRKMPESVIADSDAFFVPDRSEFSITNYPTWMRSYDLGFMNMKNECKFAGRVVFPIKNVKGVIIGFVGWSGFDKPKYLDSVNAGYKAGATTFYGMENLPTYYTSDKPVFIPEGLMCTNYLRSKGFYSMSALGSHLSKYQAEILKRLGRRCVFVVDNDATGSAWAKVLKWQVPKASIVCVTHGKDIDGCRKENEGCYEEVLLEDLQKLLDSNNPFQTFKELIRQK